MARLREPDPVHVEVGPHGKGAPMDVDSLPCWVGRRDQVQSGRDSCRTTHGIWHMGMGMGMGMAYGTWACACAWAWATVWTRAREHGHGSMGTGLGPTRTSWPNVVHTGHLHVRNRTQAAVPPSVTRYDAETSGGRMHGSFIVHFVADDGKLYDHFGIGSQAHHLEQTPTAGSALPCRIYPAHSPGASPKYPPPPTHPTHPLSNCLSYPTPPHSPSVSNTRRR